MSARVDRRRVVEWELRERERLERELARHVREMINSLNKLVRSARSGVWVLKGDLLRLIRDVGGNALLIRETLRKLGVGYRDVEVVAHYLDEIVSTAKELIDAANRLEHSGDYVRITGDFESLVERLGRYADAVLDLLRELPFRHITPRDFHPQHGKKTSMGSAIWEKADLLLTGNGIRVLKPHGYQIPRDVKATRMVSGLSMSTRPRRLSRRELEELTPSKYLEKYFSIVLPPKIAEFWDIAGYVEDDGLIDFEGVSVDRSVSGYWERSSGKPFFDDELRKYLSWFLFDNDPRYSVLVCPAGAVCEISRDENHGHFEFEVFDREKDELIFSGAVMGVANLKKVGGKSYVDFVPIYIVIEPHRL